MCVLAHGRACASACVRARVHVRACVFACVRACACACVCACVCTCASVRVRERVRACCLPARRVRRARGRWKWRRWCEFTYAHTRNQCVSTRMCIVQGAGRKGWGRVWGAASPWPPVAIWGASCQPAKAYTRRSIWECVGTRAGRGGGDLPFFNRRIRRPGIEPGAPWSQRDTHSAT